MIPEILALILTILTGGAIQSQLAKEYIVAQRLANLVAIIAAIYLIKDIWHDISSLTQSAEAPDVPVLNPEVSLENNIAVWSWKSAMLLSIVCLFSGIFAMLRGATRELQSGGSLAFAMLGTLYVSRAEWFNNMQDRNFSWLFFSLCLIFLFFFVVFWLATARILGQATYFSPIDRAFGFLYGLVRGCLVVGAGAWVISNVWGPEIIYGEPGESLPIPLNIVKAIDDGIRQYLTLLR